MNSTPSFNTHVADEILIGFVLSIFFIPIVPPVIVKTATLEV